MTGLSWRRAARVVASFLALGLLGPLLALLLKQLSVDSAAHGFLYRFIALVWPTWGYAAAEVTLGTPLAVALAAGMTLALLASLGVVTACVARWRMALLVLWIGCLSGALALAWLNAGRDVQHLAVFPLLVSFVAYSVPFEVARRLHRVDIRH